MDKLSKISPHRYQKIRELGRNLAGGTITYLATDTATGETIIIKQFQFAQAGSNWSGFKAYEREISVLQSLNHSGVPRYLNAFETRTGFCMVQEYKDAQPLSEKCQFTPQQVKRIATSILVILAYLQSRIPPVIHRDIKPENILVDEQLNVYLVDFGFARIGGGEGAMSSVAAGTFGFMAPEQLYNHNLSNATDLYGLGATLICLLTGTKSTAINNLIDDVGHIIFKPLLPYLSQSGIDWLEKMIQAKQKDRYASANEALAALKPLKFTLVPEVKLSHKNLLFKVSQLGEEVTQIIAVSNLIARAVLEGQWQVAPHPNDSPIKLSKQSWISFKPANFKQNQIECIIAVDSSKLMPNKIYHRQIILQTNSKLATHTIRIEVHTGSVPNLTKRSFYIYLLIAVGLLTLFSLPAIYSIYYSLTMQSPQSLGVSIPPIIIDTLGNILTLVLTIFWLRLGAKLASYKPFILFGLIALFVSFLLPLMAIKLIGIMSAIAFPSYTNPSLGQMITAGLRDLFFKLIAGLWRILAAGSFLIVGYIFGFLVKQNKQAGFNQKEAFRISLLATALGISLGCGRMIGFLNPFFILAVIGSGLSLVAQINYALQNHQKLLARYRQSEPYRIQP